MTTFTPDGKEAFRTEFRRLYESKTSLYGYVKHAVIEDREGWKDGAHIRTICNSIQDFIESETKRGLMLTVAPRHMKSIIVSNALPAWYISNHPQADVIMASYALSLARDNGRACRRMFDTDIHRRVWPSLTFDVDSADAYQLHGKENGRPNLVCAGVGGPITGKGADLFIIDDPIKGMEDADSEVYKKRLYDWYRMVVLSRLTPTGKIILIQTRWTYDDLAGHILQDDPGEWECLNLPAVNPDGTVLWPERYDREYMDRQRASMGERAFDAQYQGRPTPTEGGMFKRPWIRHGPVMPADAIRCRYWDKAATHGGGDWTAGALLAMKDGRYCIEDMVRLQGSPLEVRETIRATAERDGYSVRIRMEQEPGSSGVDVIDTYAREVLQGYDFRAEKVTGSKELRAQSFAAAMENGNVDMAAGVWNDALIDELLQFPFGRHDDQTDACTGAFRDLSQGGGGGHVYLF